MPLLSYGELNKALPEPDKHEALCRSKFFLEALYYASAEFHRQLTSGNRENPKRGKSLYKYLSRAATRCTPFGRFAAVGTFTIGKETHLERPGLLPTVARFTLETSFLEKLAQKLIDVRSLPYLTLRLNPTLFESGREYRYEARPPGGVVRSYSVKKTPILKSILRCLRKCDTSPSLYQAISAEFEIDKESFDRYMLQLITGGIITTQLVPDILNCEEYLPILTGIARSSGNKEMEKALVECAGFIAGVNSAADPVEVIEEFRQRDWVKEMHKGDGPVVQTDSYIDSDMHFTLSDNIVEQIKDFMRLNAMYSSAASPYMLSRFRSRYEAAYENSPQPLVNALDEETGIGYGNMRQAEGYRMLQGLGHGGSFQQQPLSLSVIQRTLLGVIESREYNHRSIALEKYFTVPESADLSKLNFGRSFNAMFQVIGSEEDEFTLSEIRFCGSGALNLLARFAYGSDEIGYICREAAEREKSLLRADEVAGEISYIPNPRSTNVLHRSAWHCCTIEYLSPGSDKKTGVPLSDLWIHIAGGEIRLYSAKLKKYVVPRMASAHNYSNNTSAPYRFLGDLQSQGNRLSNAFTWGALESVFSHLPRLTYKKIIVQPEKWKISIGDYKTKNNSDIKGLRERLRHAGCPEHVLFREGDNCLWIDRDSDLALAALLDASRQRRDIWIEEFIAPTGDIGINECILPFIKLQS